MVAIQLQVDFNNKRKCVSPEHYWSSEQVIRTTGVWRRLCRSRSQQVAGSEGIGAVARAEYSSPIRPKATTLIMLRITVIMTLLVAAKGHMSLIWPLPRGGVDRSLPEYAGGKFPAGHYGCECTNATHLGAVCLSAQSCLWFENGCTVGCEW